MRLLIVLLMLTPVCLMAQEPVTAPAPIVAEAQVVEGKHSPLEKEQARAEKAKRKREQADYNREHPGPIRSFFSMVFFPMTTLFSVVMSPFGLIWFVVKWMIAVCVLAVLGLVAIFLYRFFRRRYRNTVEDK